VDDADDDENEAEDADAVDPVPPSRPPSRPSAAAKVDSRWRNAIVRTDPPPATATTVPSGESVAIS
jgi:hypothetical protein